MLAAVVFSHWLLDLIVHRADLPILPGNAGDLPRLGFGLWKVPAASILVELACRSADPTGPKIHHQRVHQVAA